MAKRAWTARRAMIIMSSMLAILGIVLGDAVCRFVVNGCSEVLVKRRLE